MNDAWWQNYYEHQHTLQPSPFARWCLPRLRPCSILDLGCGNGRDTFFLAGAGHTVMGVDGNCYPRAAGRASFLQLSFEELIDRNYRADAIYCRFVLHAIEPELQRSLLSWSSANLNPGGTLLIEARSILGNLPEDGKPRWPVDSGALWVAVSDVGLRPREFIERSGLASCASEDPVCVRMVAVKP